jgi:hypothetical protein
MADGVRAGRAVGATAQGNAVGRTSGADDIEQVLEAAVYVVVRARALNSRVVLEILYDRVDVVALFREQLLDDWGGTVTVEYVPVNTSTVAARFSDVAEDHPLSLFHPGCSSSVTFW